MGKKKRSFALRGEDENTTGKSSCTQAKITEQLAAWFVKRVC
jgi:hypothetical protein